MSPYRTQSPDTSREADEFLFAAYRAMPDWEKAARLTALTRACHELALGDLRERYPGASDDELMLRLGARWLDADTMRQVYGWDPETGEAI